MNSSSTPLAPVVIPRSEHSISRAAISPNALKVLYRLKEAGYQGFLVGGAVRDLLLGLRPKDFDVATNALPEEVRRLFRNCRLIGRRFRLAHVFFGSEIIEVATFRATAAPEREDAEDADAEAGEAGAEAGADGEADGEAAGESGNSADPGPDDAVAEFSPPSDSEHRAFDPRGRILRDNIYGTIEEDVWRRDFAANGLYYNIEDFSIWDFVDGVSDIKARRLKLIGDPETRYREDPVRMLRAVRFAAKLDFSIEPATERPIKQLAYLLDGVPPARLFDEVLKLFLSGFGAKAYRLLQQYGLFEHLFPQSAAAFALAPYAYAGEMLELGLANTDARIAADKPVTPTFLFAVLLWSAVLRELNERQAGPAPDLALLMQVCDTVLRAQQSRVAIPRRFAIPMRELLMLQPRFNRRSGVKSLSLLQHPRFRAAYDFLLLRAQVGVADPELAKWWTDIQVLPQEERVALVQARPAEPAAEGGTAAPAPGRRRRRRRRGGAARS
ncbi:MAG: polynucleotide adenylyltransferase PcnB [Pseudomonadota bacterium]|nr:polynucleotide adenylyltransferase PcnB [Pseudomonadota bacterium]